MVLKLPNSGAPFKIFIFEKTTHVRKKWNQGFRPHLPSKIHPEILGRPFPNTLYIFLFVLIKNLLLNIRTLKEKTKNVF
jgi:hypothetical protein